MKAGPALESLGTLIENKMLAQRSDSETVATIIVDENIPTDLATMASLLVENPVVLGERVVKKFKPDNSISSIGHALFEYLEERAVSVVKNRRNKPVDEDLLSKFRVEARGLKNAGFEKPEEICRRGKWITFWPKNGWTIRFHDYLWLCGKVDEKSISSCFAFSRNPMTDSIDSNNYDEIAIGEWMGVRIRKIDPLFWACERMILGMR